MKKRPSCQHRSRTRLSLTASSFKCCPPATAPAGSAARRLCARDKLTSGTSKAANGNASNELWSSTKNRSDSRQPKPSGRTDRRFLASDKRVTAVRLSSCTGHASSPAEDSVTKVVEGADASESARSVRPHCESLETIHYIHATRKRE